MKTYNGHRSWNAWNVSLWINNDEFIYNFAMKLLDQYDLSLATKIFIGYFHKTPDGAKYNRLSVFNALKDLKS